MKKWSLKIVALVSALVLVGMGAGIALASSGLTTIQVNAKPVNFYVNGANVTPTGGVFDNQGSRVPDALIYDGTTYVPIRMVSNMIGQSVQWVGSKYAVAIGRPITGSYLMNLQPYRGQVKTPQTGTMGGTTYEDVVQFTDGGGYGLSGNLPNVYYNLNGSYSTLTFEAGLDDSGADGSTITILGDGNSLWTHTFNPGDLPIAASVPVAGVNQLEIEVADNGGWGTAVDLANAQLQP